MIDDDITFSIYGHRSIDLKPNSHKKVWAVCEGENCERKGGRGRWVEFCRYRVLCHLCACKKQCIQKCETPNKKRDCIDDEKTFAEKGYRSTELKHGSHNEVWRVCLECGEGSWQVFQSCSDLCHGCACRTDEHLMRLSASHQGISLDDWTHYKKYEPYCEKFNNEFKEKIREKFGRVCFMCPTTEEENKRKLCVHHVNYDKECMCNGVECEFVPLCNSCHSKTNSDRELWERLIINVLYYEGYIE